MGKAWKIIPRPLLETILNNHAQHHRVRQPLILHGPRGVGKTTLLRHRLLDDWNKPPHLTGYIDFGLIFQEMQSPDHHIPWSSWFAPSGGPAPTLSSLRMELERCLESMVHAGIRLGSIGSQQIFSTLKKWHGLDGALRRIICSHGGKDRNAPTSVLWSRAIFVIEGADLKTDNDSASLLDLEGKIACTNRDEAAYLREAILSLRLAKEVIRIHQTWRANAVAHLNRTGGFSRSLANSATDWPCLLMELLSAAAELDFFQPKLVINNIDILRRAIQTDDLTVSAAMYHDSFLWRLIALGVNEECLPVILLTSDSYYSYRAFMDFGFPDIFISRENFGWSPQEAKMHMVAEYFNESEWKVIVEVLGSNPRHLSELYGLKQSPYYQNSGPAAAILYENFQVLNSHWPVVKSAHLIVCLRMMEDGRGITFEDIIDAYLAYLQVNVVNPAMESALDILQKFAFDALNGRIPKDQLRFGAPWRHPPHTDNPNQRFKWAKLQLVDFIQSLVNAEFGVNYLADCSLEIFDDPSTTAMLEVGLLYAQRDPSYIRPITRGIQRCLVRWLVQQRMQMSIHESIQFLWQRIFRGRSYRHLMKEVGYK